MRWQRPHRGSQRYSRHAPNLAPCSRASRRTRGKRVPREWDCCYWRSSSIPACTVPAFYSQGIAEYPDSPKGDYGKARYWRLCGCAKMLTLTGGSFACRAKAEVLESAAHRNATLWQQAWLVLLVRGKQVSANAVRLPFTIVQKWRQSDTTSVQI